MYSLAVILSLWLIIGLCVVVKCCMLLIRLIREKTKVLAEAEKYAEDAKAAVDDKYNRYALLSPIDLHNTLVYIFAKQIELASARYITSEDKESAAKLYGYLVYEITTYLGSDNIDAIERYHGKGFILRWCELQYKILENSGVLAKVIDKSGYADRVIAELEIKKEKGA